MEVANVLHHGIDTSYDGLFLWRNDVFSLGMFYSNAYGD